MVIRRASPPCMVASPEVRTICYQARPERKLVEEYIVQVQPGDRERPPLLCIPPVGVGISREFFSPLQREWAALGAPAEMHAPDLLGCGYSSPKPRRFYTPALWADQMLSYMSTALDRPAVLVVQGGLLPVALEMWRRVGSGGIAGMSLISPPPLAFFSPTADAERGVRGRFRTKASGRGKQRAAWALSQSTAGGLFYRYLRAGDGLPRVRAFSERNLFASADAVDDEWMAMCAAGAADTRSRHATFSYLCGTIPGGVWREDRSDLLASLDVPCQVLRGDVPKYAGERFVAFTDQVPKPSECSLVAGGRSVLPYENARETAYKLKKYLDANF